MTGLATCPVCGVAVKPENLVSHVARVHPKAKEELRQVQEKIEVTEEPTRRTAPISPFGVVLVGILALIAILLLFLALVPASPPSGGIPIGSEAETFTLPEAGGGSYTLPDPPDRYVLLEFLHPRCSHCINVAGELTEVHDGYLGRVEFISIATRLSSLGPWTEQEVLDFKTGHGHVWTYLMDPDGTVATSYGYRATPYFVLLDPSGVVVWTHEGSISAEALGAELDAILP